MNARRAKPLLPIGINMDFLDTVFMDPPLTGTCNPLFTITGINSKAQSTFVIVFSFVSTFRFFVTETSLFTKMEVEVDGASVTTVDWTDVFMDFFGLKLFDFVFCCFLFLRYCSFHLFFLAILPFLFSFVLGLVFFFSFSSASVLFFWLLLLKHC